MRMATNTFFFFFFFQAAKSLLSSKASVAAVGDLFQLPYGEDLGLTV